MELNRIDCERIIESLQYSQLKVILPKTEEKIANTLNKIRALKKKLKEVVTADENRPKLSGND